MTLNPIIRLLENERRYNLHSHTQFCDGRATMRDFAAQAVAEGFRHYGFSPHSPIPIESPCNMAEADVPVYLAEVESIRRIYADRPIKFYASMEIDYLSPQFGPASDYFANLPLDYRIGSVHFIPSDEGFVDIDGRFESFKLKMDRYFHNDIRHVVESFYSQSTKMFEAGGFDIIGHFDKIGHNASHFKPGIEEESWYRSLVNDLIDLIIEKKITVEINTKAWADHGRMFPAINLLPRLVEADTPIVVNSDAHYPNLIDASRGTAFEMLDKISSKKHQHT